MSWLYSSAYALIFGSSTKSFRSTFFGTQLTKSGSNSPREFVFDFCLPKPLGKKRFYDTGIVTRSPVYRLSAANEWITLEFKSIIVLREHVCHRFGLGYQSRQRLRSCEIKEYLLAADRRISLEDQVVRVDESIGINRRVISLENVHNNPMETANKAMLVDSESVTRPTHAYPWTNDALGVGGCSDWHLPDLNVTHIQLLTAFMIRDEFIPWWHLFVIRTK